MPAPPITLHATPPLAPLPASDAESLYYIALFQLAAPGRYGVETGDWGQNGGKLPYVTHLGHKVPSAYLPNLPGFQDPDAHLSAEEKTDALSWKSYLDANIVDLVNHTYYSLPPNYPQTIAKAQLATLSFPQTLYIPQRIRSVIKSRLTFVGLWGLGGLNDGDAVEEDQRILSEKFITGPGGTVAPRAWTGWRSGQEAEKRRRQWGEQQLDTRIKAAFDPLARRLEGKNYFFGDMQVLLSLFIHPHPFLYLSHSPTTPDLHLFSLLTFLLTPSLPNPLLPTLLLTTYPSLSAYHDRLLTHLSLDWASFPLLRPRPRGVKAASWGETLSSFIPGPSTSASTPNKKEKEEKKEKTSKEKSFERGRWLWFAGAAVSMVSYLFWSGIVAYGEFDDEEGEWIEVEEEVRS
ncbi:hypothetical protein L198_06657 [Cryptococcus wingfieldii CBS 7118]|uniref:Mitochondrial outer membrane transport complex Sam37/metaxin N-terminal domain-containing protein n=1 Tax=Cryptococcus wingfieldii CBS 7118 TaxID=1295528 RepID=A0A1E3IK98_9TREE|nr:hypothetical protein L198_06657 [Cryptococcus wingfieldii CBS 7118]ODN88855.1 hypothetical protein L198_06657 [Cryptococcus wingfieldii CBS 7118]